MNHHDFIPGQRWISDTEPDLGLGSLLHAEGRTITLLFPASGEKRTYAQNSAPLTRVRFQAGDRVEDQAGDTLTISQVEETEGLLCYRGHNDHGAPSHLSETELSHFIQFNRPHERLFAGQIDDNHWFSLRYQTHRIRQQLELSALTGLGGARTDLLPHQLYIAHEVSKRLAPRVLLADEVGLGKTIEACLVLHTQLLTGRAQRALIVVPDSLLHQWLVELKRRFNLNFSLFDEERCQAIEQTDEADNPFLAEQLVLCGLDLITGQRLSDALKGEWDIMIVDEAHHLEWHQDNPSRAYSAIEALASVTPGVLLLTATPEQLGRSAHFARLRLLDPDRYYSLEAFRQEEKRYQPIAAAISRLVNETTLSADSRNELRQLLPGPQADDLLGQLNHSQDNPQQARPVRQQLINLLLDRHGTGRGLFRNTRDRIKGFKPRQLHSYPLALPAEYFTCIAANNSSPINHLYPERLYHPASPEWWRFDPRLDWLIQITRSLADAKVLVICAHAKTAIELELGLRTREGVAAALFHEQMSIIERDRAAAWFADNEQHCQLLICSEIGSEGRNFQFAHHLVLFDLPTNPDLLEQRIGRLDRIGQQQQVQLHAPYFYASAQEVLFRWYHEGLNAFVHTCPPGQQILAQLRPALLQALEEGMTESAAVELLIASTHQLFLEISDRLRLGRDHLLELNSCREQEAEKLLSDILQQDHSGKIEPYMASLFEAYGIEQEQHSQQSLVIKPGMQMLTEHFPALPADGCTITYHRATALAHEDWQFLTWEHPMVRGSMAMLLEAEQGNSTAIAARHPRLAAGSLLLEMLYVLECPAPRILQPGRFLPPTLLRVLIDQNLNELDSSISHPALQAAQQPLDKNIARKIIDPLRERIKAMLRQAEASIIPRQDAITAEAMTRMRGQYDSELQRLESLQQVNPNIKPEELSLLLQHKQDLTEHLEASRVRLDAVRLIVPI